MKAKVVEIRGVPHGMPDSLYVRQVPSSAQAGKNKGISLDAVTGSDPRLMIASKLARQYRTTSLGVSPSGTVDGTLAWKCTRACYQTARSTGTLWLPH